MEGPGQGTAGGANGPTLGAVSTPTPAADGFADLLAHNAAYQAGFTDGGFDGIARAGVAMVTCMDSRIEPLGMIGLRIGDAKILRTPGGRITPDALVGCVLGVHLLGVERILVVPHTRCAMASGEDADIVDRARAATGEDLSDLSIGASPDQHARLVEDVALLREHPHLAGRVQVGGFLYDVDSGALTQVL
ncbi:hypothetical protein GCM10009714_20690 [Microlunatus capsulatus]